MQNEELELPLKLLDAMFAKAYPEDWALVLLSRNNRDFMMDAIAARHRYIAFRKGIQSILQLLYVTDEMMEAGYNATRLPDGTPQFYDAGFCLGHSAKIYEAMINEALYGNEQV